MSPESTLDIMQPTFGDHECNCLNRVLQRTPGALKLCEDAAKCGWDTSAIQQSLHDQLEIARSGKATFFPNRP